MEGAVNTCDYLQEMNMAYGIAQTHITGHPISGISGDRDDLVNIQKAHFQQEINISYGMKKMSSKKKLNL